MTQIPYEILAVLLAALLGAVGSLLIMFIKLVQRVARLEARLENKQPQHHKKSCYEETD